MKKLALLLLLTGLQLSSSAQTWPIGGWPFTVTTGSFWNMSTLADNYSFTNYPYYNYITSSMISDVLQSTNNFADAPAINSNFGGLNQRQYWSTYANTLCTKSVTEKISYTLKANDLSEVKELENAAKTLYQSSALGIRREAVVEIINLVKNLLNSKGIGMEMVTGIFVTGSYLKDKYGDATNFTITYTYTIPVPCPSDYYTGGGQ